MKHIMNEYVNVVENMNNMKNEVYKIKYKYINLLNTNINTNKNEIYSLFDQDLKKIKNKEFISKYEELKLRKIFLLDTIRFIESENIKINNKNNKNNNQTIETLDPVNPVNPVNLVNPVNPVNQVNQINQVNQVENDGFGKMIHMLLDKYETTQQSPEDDIPYNIPDNNNNNINNDKFIVMNLD